jgi:hypothetical protein
MNDKEKLEQCFKEIGINFKNFDFENYKQEIHSYVVIEINDCEIQFGFLKENGKYNSSENSVFCPID